MGQHYFSYIAAASDLCFPGILLTAALHNILSKPLASFQHNQTIDGSERGINPVAMTIMNPWKEYWLSWGSYQQLSKLKRICRL